MRWLNTFIALSKKQTRADMIAEHLKDMEAVEVYIIDERPPEHEAMYKEQLAIQDMLGFERGNNTQNWLRTHHIMLDHEQRLKAMEGKV